MCDCNPEVGCKCVLHAGDERRSSLTKGEEVISRQYARLTDTLTLLLDQKTYVVTPSTGVVHSLPCIRSTAHNPLPWPEFRDKDDDRACSHCLPNGLPIEGAS